MTKKNVKEPSAADQLSTNLRKAEAVISSELNKLIANDIFRSVTIDATILTLFEGAGKYKKPVDNAVTNVTIVVEL